MEEILMTIFAESVYFFENIIIFGGYVILAEYKGKRVITGLSLQIVLFYLLQKVTLPMSLELSGAAVYSTIINFSVALLIGCIFYKGSFKRKFGILMMYMGPAILGEIVTYELLMKIDLQERVPYTDIGMYSQTTEFRNVAVMLCGQVIVILWGSILLLWKLIEERRWIKESVLYITLPIYQVFIFVIYYSFCGEIRFENVLAGWCLFMFGIIMDVSVIYLINGIFQKLKVEREISKVQEWRQEELAYYMMVNDRMEQSRFLRHEFANQMQVIYGLLETQDTEVVKQMLDKTKEKVETVFGVEKGNKAE